LRALHAVLSWCGLAAMAGVVAWLGWTIISRTPVGTAKSEETSRLRPTITAIAAAYSGVVGDAPPVVQLPATCAACHTIAGTAARGTIGPDLTHAGTSAAARLVAADYAGTADTADAFIRESIVDPGVDVVPRDGYGAPGASTMPAGVGQAMPAADLDRLVTYLASLR
jgi:hypothetical protein